MPWVRLDDQFHMRPRVRSAGPEGRALFIAGLCYSSQNLTDGHLPAPAIPLVAAMAEVAPSVADRLVEIGLWDSAPDGYQIIDFLSYNPSRQQVIAEREAGAERQRRSRASRKMSRRDSAVTSGDPVPVPKEITVLSSSGHSRANGQAVDNCDDDVPAEVWDHVADIKLALEPAGSIRSPTPWKRKCAANARTELAVQAQRWWHMFDLDPYRLAQALVDGQAPRHVPRRQETP